MAPAKRSSSLSLATRAVHAGEPSPRIGGAGIPPIFQCTLFELGERGEEDEVRYPRLNNLPNHQVLHRKLADLEGGEDAVVTASGMAAISTTLLALARGGHVLAQDGLYGGTHGLLTRDADTLGLSFDFIDASDPGSWRASLRSNTRVIYTEAMSNPLLAVADHRAVVDFAREHELLSVIDNTFASPVNFQPLRLGYDVSIHSATKYLNGHSDIVAGVCIGAKATLQPIRELLDHLGGSLDPHACFLLHRGLRALPLRVERQSQTALLVAQCLAGHSAVARVYYPGLAAHPQHARARELFSGFGGMLSADLVGGTAAAERLVSGLELFVPSPSLGGVESLATLPVRTSHAGLTPEERERCGISDGLVRFSIGIESADDLISDLTQALAKV